MTFAMTTKKLAYPPRKNKKTNPLIYGVYVAIFLGFLYIITSLRHTDDNHPTIILAKPVDLKNTPPTEMTTTVLSDATSSTDTPATALSAQEVPEGTTQHVTQNSTPKTNTVVWEMSQADPTKHPATQGLPPPTDPAPSGTAPSDALAQDTPAQNKTPLSNQMGNQAILHPDDVPAVEHSALPHLSTKAKPSTPQDTQNNDNGETDTQKLNAKLKEKETDILKEVKESLNRQDTSDDLGKTDTSDTSDDLDSVGN